MCVIMQMNYLEDDIQHRLIKTPASHLENLYLLSLRLLIKSIFFISTWLQYFKRDGIYLCNNLSPDKFIKVIISGESCCRESYLLSSKSASLKLMILLSNSQLLSPLALCMVFFPPRTRVGISDRFQTSTKETGQIY